MCIGDSITDGYHVPGSYRKFLYHGLIKKGYKIKMIGTKNKFTSKYIDEKAGEIIKYEDDNIGYNGFTIKSYRNKRGIYELLKETKCLSKNPDIIILQIGTNNILDNHYPEGNIEDFNILIDYILDNIPSTSMLFVTEILLIDFDNNIFLSYFLNYIRMQNIDLEQAKNNFNNSIKYFNSEIISNVKNKSKMGRNIRPANVNLALTDIKTQLEDGIHPNNIGYKAIGEYWVEIISNYLNEINYKK